MATLKFWKWFHRSKKPNIQNEEKDKPEEKPKLYPSRDAVLITDESNIALEPCIVLDDHRIKFRKKTADIKEDRPAHTLTLPLKDLWPTFLGRRLAPKFQRFRVYTIQKEGEITHDPNLTAMTEAQKMRIEKMIQLKGTATKADIVQTILAGLKGKESWWQVLGWGIIICVIVFLFLFAFQIQPNM